MNKKKLVKYLNNFKVVMSSIRYLARTGLANRGGTWDTGNLIYLLQERSLENSAMKLWLEKRNNWPSGNIQNEILKIMVHFILRKIKIIFVKVRLWILWLTALHTCLVKNNSVFVFVT